MNCIAKTQERAQRIQHAGKVKVVSVVFIQDCIRPAKTLSYMINSRHAAVISDVELSVLKVSLLERVQLHEPAPTTVSTAAATTQFRLLDLQTNRQVTAPSSSSSAVPSRERKGAHHSAAVTSSANRVATWRTFLNRLQLAVCLVSVAASLAVTL